MQLCNPLHTHCKKLPPLSHQGVPYDVNPPSTHAAMQQMHAAATAPGGVSLRARSGGVEQVEGLRLDRDEIAGDGSQVVAARAFTAPAVRQLPPAR